MYLLAVDEAEELKLRQDVGIVILAEGVVFKETGTILVNLGMGIVSGGGVDGIESLDSVSPWTESISAVCKNDGRDS